MRARLTHLSRNKLVVTGLASAIVLGLGGTAAGYAAFSRTVTVSVDGKESEVRTFASDVGEVLASKGIEPGKHDSVVPDVDSEVSEGSRIAVRLGKPLTLTVDGRERTLWTTATTVATALDQLGVGHRSAELSVSRSADIDRSGMALAVTTPKLVSVKVADAKAKRHNVPVTTVADLLAEVDADVDRNDVVRPSRSAAVVDGTRVVVTKIGVRTKRVPREPIAAPVRQQNDPTLLEGTTKTVQPGSDGARDVTYQVRFRNGKVVKRTILKQRVVDQPVARVVKIGTKPKPEPKPEPAAPAANFASGGTVWDSIAQCESGGNWAANTGNGYYGGLQFSPSTWAGYGGTGMPHQNSREQQIAIAERVAAAEGGYGAWPHCGAKFG